MEEARTFDGPFDVEFDFDRGTFRVVPHEPDEHSAWLDCANVSGGRLDGGRRLRLDNDQASGCQNEAECTTGFPMRFNQRYGIVTAGHCMDENGVDYAANANGFVTNSAARDADMYWVNQPNDIYATANAYWYDGPGIGNNENDVAFASRNSSTTGYPGRIWKWDTGEWRNITGYEATWAPLGMTVCAAASPASQNGASTYCGEVVDVVSNVFGGSSGTQRWTEVDYTQGDWNQGMSGGRGSSGGTIFYAGHVYGIQSHGSNCPDVPGAQCSPARYLRVGGINLGMTAVSADVRYICYYQSFCDRS